MPPVTKFLAVYVLALGLYGCGVNNIPTFEEQAKADWVQVQNQYKRRANLIPNLVETVKGYAAQERETLEAVVKARAAATQATLPPELLTDPAAFQKFQQAQGQLGGALSRLLVTVKRYPDLKSKQNYLKLQDQLECTENRIVVARRDYIQAVRKYNTELVTLPGRL
jgi:LemA protein